MLVVLSVLTPQLQRFKEKHGKQRTIYRKSAFLRFSTVIPVSYHWSSTYSIFRFCCRTDIVSTSAKSRISGTITTVSTSNWTGSVRTTVRIRTTIRWISWAADVRSSTVCRSTVIRWAAAGCHGQCRTAANDCASCSIVRWTHHLCLRRHLALQLSFWTHRFHAGQSVHFVCHFLLLANYIAFIRFDR